MSASQAAESVFGMTPPNPDSGEEVWVWGGEGNGKFLIKSAYKILISQPNALSSDMWLPVWRWRGPNRIRHFLWLVIQDKLLNNSERVRRHMASLATCEYCRHPSETVLHVLRDCPFAGEVWDRVEGFDTSAGSWRSEINIWLRHGLGSDRSLLFGIICWFIWKSRKERIFNDDRSPAASVAFRSQNWSRVVAEVEVISTRNIFATQDRRIVDVAWEPGPEQWVTLNSDGSVDKAEGRAAAGGWKAIAQTDSKAAVLILNSGGGSTNHFALDKAHFQQLRSRDWSRDWSLVIKHTYREGNRGADYLACIGYDYPLGSHTISISESRLGYFLRMPHGWNDDPTLPPRPPDLFDYINGLARSVSGN
ncbi:Putative ribonuclease H protein At1g65750 [Linum perenne]